MENFILLDSSNLTRIMMDLGWSVYCESNILTYFPTFGPWFKNDKIPIYIWDRIGKVLLMGGDHLEPQIVSTWL